MGSIERQEADTDAMFAGVDWVSANEEAMRPILADATAIIWAGEMGTVLKDSLRNRVPGRPGFAAVGTIPVVAGQPYLRLGPTGWIKMPAVFDTQDLTFAALVRLHADAASSGLIMGTSGAGAGASLYFSDATHFRMLSYFSPGGSIGPSNVRNCKAWAVLIGEVSLAEGVRTSDGTGDGSPGSNDTIVLAQASGAARVLSPIQSIGIGFNTGSALGGDIEFAGGLVLKRKLAGADERAILAQAMTIEGAARGLL